MSTRGVIRLMSLFVVIGFGSGIFAEDEIDFEGTPVVAFSTPDCSLDGDDDKTQAFDSLRDMYWNAYSERNYWGSFHPEYDEDKCISTMESMTVVERQQTYDYAGGYGFLSLRNFNSFWNTKQIQRTRHPPVRNRSSRELREIRDANSCWMAEADSQSVYYNTTSYDFRVDDYIVGMGRFEFDTIAINLSRITFVANWVGLDRYALLVQVLIHESWHGAEPRRLESSFHRERWVQERTYHTYTAIYDVEPPLSYLSEEEFNTLYKEWKQIHNIAEQERSQYEKTMYNKLADAMKEPPRNEEYDRWEDVISPCE